MYTTLITPAELLPHLEDPEWAIVDARFWLAETERGRNDYLAAHIPGAVYVHLDEDLSAPVIRGVTGRHPLPTVEQAGRVFSRLGIGSGVQVVAYDEAGGTMAAGRVWWMLRWLGHEAAAVLNGGWQAWQKAGYPGRGGAESRPQREFKPRPRPEMIVSAAEVERLRQDPAFRVLDARAADRFRGENEIIDPVAGHIPGAVSAPALENLDAEGAFLPPEALRQRYERLLGGVPAERVVAYCGSGVTATHDLLALMVAGLGEGRLYAGSWSEWITDPRRPVARGAG